MMGAMEECPDPGVCWWVDTARFFPREAVGGIEALFALLLLLLLSTRDERRRR
jgi:hypothetical protein